MLYMREYSNLHYKLICLCSAGLNNGKDFKGETSKQKRDFSPQLCICDSEEDLLDGYGDDMLAELVN